MNLLKLTVIGTGGVFSINTKNMRSICLEYCPEDRSLYLKTIDSGYNRQKYKLASWEKDIIEKDLTMVYRDYFDQSKCHCLINLLSSIQHVRMLEDDEDEECEEEDEECEEEDEECEEEDEECEEEDYEDEDYEEEENEENEDEEEECEEEEKEEEEERWLELTFRKDSVTGGIKAKVIKESDTIKKREDESKDEGYVIREFIEKTALLKSLRAKLVEEKDESRPKMIPQVKIKRNQGLAAILDGKAPRFCVHCCNLSFWQNKLESDHTHCRQCHSSMYASIDDEEWHTIKDN